jgi:glycosyltransferase involved in cell wall biosynthesis
MCVEFFETTPGIFEHMDAINNADILVVNTQGYKQDYIDRGVKAEKIQIVPNMITKREFDPFNRVHKRKFIFTAGRMVDQKQQSILIEAMNLIKDDLHEYDLLIAGDGELRADIEKQIRDYNLEGRVKLVGVVDNLGDYYENCDFFVLPSKHEGSPLVIYEAAAFGKLSVVFKDSRPFEEMFSPDDGIIMVEEMTAELLGQSMIKVVREQLHINSSQKMFDLYNRYSDETIIWEWVRIIYELEKQ